MSWYQWGGLWLMAWLFWGQLWGIGGILRDIASALERIAKALGDPQPGSDLYGEGGLRNIAKAIRERR